MKFLIKAIILLISICSSKAVNAQSNSENRVNAGFTCEEKILSIDWTTMQEKNSRYFVVEVSHDSIHFEPLSTQKASGNSFKASSYTYQTKADTIDCYFRIKLVLMDGETAFSNVLFVPGPQAIVAQK